MLNIVAQLNGALIAWTILTNIVLYGSDKRYSLLILMLFIGINAECHLC